MFQTSSPRLSHLSGWPIEGGALFLSLKAALGRLHEWAVRDSSGPKRNGP